MSPPTAQILTIGDELLFGDVIDRNKAFLAKRCRALGFEVQQSLSLRDRVGEISRCLAQIRTQCDLVLISGGLGPTSDDRTASAIADFAQRPLERRPDLVSRLQQWFARRGRPMVSSNLKQAELPQGALALDNPAGTAVGIWLELLDSHSHDESSGRSTIIVSMPGVPRELHLMMQEQVEPRLHSKFKLSMPERRCYRVMGLGESMVAELVEPLFAENHRSELRVHYRASRPEVLITVEGFQQELPALEFRDLNQETDDQAKLKASGKSASLDHQAIWDQAFSKALGSSLYAIGEQTLPERLVESLLHRNLTIAMAESCTGGMIASKLTDISGVSRCFLGSIVAYNNSVKKKQLGVPEELLDRHGAVSESVARSMAEGARKKLDSDLALSVTGIAGPGGATEDKPVGTVFWAVCDRFQTRSGRLQLYGDRTSIRESTANWAFKHALDLIQFQGH